MSDFMTTVREMLEEMFSQRGDLPPCVVYFQGMAAKVVFFEDVDMDSGPAKYELSFTAQLIAHYLSGITHMAYCSEAWVLHVPEQAALFKQHGGNMNAIEQAIYKQYGTIGESPYKKEGLITVTDDGEHEFIVTSSIEHHLDSDRATLTELSEGPKTPSDIDPSHRFNGLMAKTRQFTDMVEKASQFPGAPDDKDAIITILLKQHIRHLNTTFDVDKIIRVAKHTASKISGDSKSYNATMH